MQIEYAPSLTLKEFHAEQDNLSAFVRGIMGPIGSGKSVGMCFEIMQRAMAQRPYNGVRRSRWVIIRNTYRELVDTTIKTWTDWFPVTMGKWSQQNMTHTITQRLKDGSIMYLEVMFRALDRPSDVKKLLSLELTGGWINEAREIPRQVLDMLQGRVGRYPSKRQGGPSWCGVIMDTNPPDSDHWWYRLFEEEVPKNWKGFRQPSGKSDEAENVSNLPPFYYDNMIPGKDQEWINVYVHGQYGFIADGKPVFPEYNDDIHHTDDELPLAGSGTIYVGIDFGLTPAAAIGQLSASGQMQIIDELVTEDMGAVNFGKLLHEKLNREYCGCQLEIYADPAGEQRAQTDEVTPFQILWNQGLEAWPTYTNDFTIRREAVADYMGRLDFKGHPAFIIGPKAPMVRKAMAGGYKYKRMQVSGQERFMDKPDKGRYSHVADALQYLFLGAVGGDRVIGGYGKQEIDYSETNRQIV